MLTGQDEGESALAAEAPAAHVQVQVIAMRSIIIRSDHPLEEAAGALMDLAQKGALVAPSSPAFQDSDAAAVGEGKAGDVDCIAGCMLTAGARRPVVPIPTGIGAPVFDTRYCLSEMFLCRRLQDVRLEYGVGRREGTGRHEAVIEVDRGAADLNGIGDAAAILERAVGDGTETMPACAQREGAELGVFAETGNRDPIEVSARIAWHLAILASAAGIQQQDHKGRSDPNGRAKPPYASP